MSHTGIHPTASVSPQAEMGENVEIGPFCLVGPKVRMGDGSTLHSHVVIDGNVSIGRENQFFPFCSIGAAPQDITYRGENTRLEIGNNNVFREYVSIHRASTKEDQITKVGNNCLFMTSVHLGHDVRVEDDCIVASGVLLGGHVKVGSGVFIGGQSSFKQFVCIGRGAYLGGGSISDRDIPAFCTGHGNRLRLRGINIVGLRRRGCSKSQISQVVQFYRKMESAETSPIAFVQDFLSGDKGDWENPIIEEMCQSIVQSKLGVAPFMDKG